MNKLMNSFNGGRRRRTQGYLFFEKWWMRRYHFKYIVLRTYCFCVFDTTININHTITF